MKVTVVGGGFGGVKAALELARDPKNQVTLISNKTNFQYYPSLYSAATGHSHLESWVPLGTIFAKAQNVQVKLDTIKSINPRLKTLDSESGHIYSYEKCILALGAVTTYFNIKGLDTYAYGIKSAAEIKKLKQHLYTDIAERHTIDKRYVIIGAGPTGVELAAALGTYIQRLCQRYGVKRHKIKINLIEAAPRVLPRMSQAASKKVARRLQKLGVQVQTGKSVESASSKDLMVSGSAIDTHTVIWTSGVANNPFYQQNSEQFELAPNGRVVVDDKMQAAKDIYVIGDNAATKYTGLAQTALHDAIFVAKNIKRYQNGQPLKKYKAVLPPVVVPVGERWAIFEWRWIRLSGWPAALIRRAADFVGYSDILPFGQALGVWRASRLIEDDYFTPTVINSKK